MAVLQYRNVKKPPPKKGGGGRGEMNPDVGEKVVKRQLFPDLNTLCFCLLEQLT